MEKKVVGMGVEILKFRGAVRIISYFFPSVGCLSFLFFKLSILDRVDISLTNT